MITGKEFYDVLAAVVPLYVAMILGYASVKWWNILTPNQSLGINRFVSVFAAPFLAFKIISTNNIYAMNWRFIAADSLQKVAILVILFLWQSLSKKGSLEWMITLFSLSTLPNTLVVGIPLLDAMYGPFTRDLMAQVLVMQFVVWYIVLIFMLEYRGAKILINDKFPETGGSIKSFRVESDVISLDGQDQLETDTVIGDDGKLHVVVRRSMSSSLFEHGKAASARDLFSSQYSKRSSWRSLSTGELSKRHSTPMFVVQNIDSPSRALAMDIDDVEEGETIEKKTQMPRTTVMTKLILTTVWRKLIRNPNTYSSLLGLIWSLISFRCNVELPTIVKGSIYIISDTGLGMAMFSLGLFMSLQPKIIACGKSVAIFGLAIRFIIGPGVAAATSLAIGLRGNLLHVAILQAALPLGIIPFVYAREYNVHANILSTGFFFGMAIALPITILYYVLLEL